MPIAPARRRRLAIAALSALAVSIAASAAGPAFAQGWGWQWPWEADEPRRPPPTREPAYPPPEQRAPPPSSSPQGNWAGGRASICLQLEQRLVQENQRGNQSRDLLPQIEAQVREADRAYQGGQAELERRDCYDYFLFSKTLRRSRQCVDLANQTEDARRRLGELEAQRQNILSSGSRSYEDDIIRELARNNCGGNYAQESRRRDRGPLSSFWDDEESGGWGGQNQYGALPYNTYRTLCVRTCDGYYFPVSFSTVPNHFERDEETCHSKCAAPAELYYHQNPGGAVEQALSFRTQEPYTTLQSAFRYRKEYVQGCSCKAAEYVAPDAAPADSEPTGAVPPGRRAEATEKARP